MKYLYSFICFVINYLEIKGIDRVCLLDGVV